MESHSHIWYTSTCKCYCNSSAMLLPSVSPIFRRLRPSYLCLFPVLHSPPVPPNGLSPASSWQYTVHRFYSLIKVGTYAKAVDPNCNIILHVHVYCFLKVWRFYDLLIRSIIVLNNVMPWHCYAISFFGSTRKHMSNISTISYGYRECSLN